MQNTPQEIIISIAPESRFDLVDVTARIRKDFGNLLERYKKAMYCSYHTTAGYLDQSLAARLDYSRDQIVSLIKAFQGLFPIDADYRHDRMELRNELTEEQKACEPRNADSHLTFMGSGLKNCVTYNNVPEAPVYFIDLDGVHEFGQRKRQTSVLFYDDETVVFNEEVDVPVSGHQVDSINLSDPKLGYLDKLNELLQKYEVKNGRIEISLAASERNAGITVNEFETLLMEHDLPEVLSNPVKFMASKGKYALKNPRVIPSRTIEYAKYDFVHIFNELMDAFKFSESVVEKVLAKFIEVPAKRFLRMKRGISFLVSDGGTGKTGRIVRGTYQAPILVQWKPTSCKTRRVKLTIKRIN